MAKNLVILFVTILLSGGMLIYAESKLAIVINNQGVAQDLGTLQKLFPETKEFVLVEFTDDTGLIKKVYEAKDAGYAYVVENQGFKDKLGFAVALDKEGKIIGYEVTSFNDTEGYGSQIKDEPFVSSIVGKTSKDTFETIAGATISCSAIVVGLDAVLVNYNAMMNVVDGGMGTPPVAETPTETPTETPVEAAVPLGSPIAIFKEVSEKSQATVTETKEDGNILTYTVSAPGYAVLEGEYGEPLPNIIVVQVDKEAKKILSVEVTTASDTKNLGTKITNAAFLDQFKDLSYAEESVEVDVITSATVSCTSVVNAVLAAIQASK